MDLNYKCLDSYIFQELQQKSSTQYHCECVMLATNFYLCQEGYIAVMLLLPKFHEMRIWTSMFVAFVCLSHCLCVRLSVCLTGHSLKAIFQNFTHREAPVWGGTDYFLWKIDQRSTKI